MEKRTLQIDPDYELNNATIRRICESKESEDAKDTLDKITQIIEEEFDKEVHLRQNQILKIEEQIFKTQKLLHILRYAIISSYYDKKTLEYPETEPSGSATFNSLFEQQNRIHPALKKLLGKNGDPTQVFQSTKRKVLQETKNSQVESNETSSQIKKVKLIEEPIVKVQEETITEQRTKTKHRIVVGNISKFISAADGDNLTHKWMVYVSGTKEAPDVSHIIDKVVFHLHPSYKPFDVVELTNYPFHLSRRGWGEFPIRIQISFKNPFNKPVEIIHNLKLDKTCSGRQTLGNESIIDIFLHEQQQREALPIIPKLENEIEVTYNELFKDEPSNFEEEIIEECPNESLNEFKHDHCYEDSFQEEKPEISSILFEHSYSVESHFSEDFLNVKDEHLEDDEEMENSLVYGLNDSYLSSNELKSSLNNVLPEPGKVLIDYEKFTFSIPEGMFKNMGEVLPYLFKRLPLYSSCANDLNYKCTFPFTAKSEEEFYSWPLPVRLSSEWSRARTIRKQLISTNFFESHKWNTKAIFMYGRSHLFSPIVSFNLFKEASQEKALLWAPFAKSKVKFQQSNLKRKREESDEEIDIEDLSDSPNKLPSASNLLQTSDPKCSFIRETALDCGIYLKSETAAERVMLEAMKCFAENLIRRSNNFLVCKEALSNELGEITVNEVQLALQERLEFSAIKKFQKTKREMDYFL